MKTKYEVTARHRKVWGAWNTTWRDTPTECAEWVAEDTAECGEFYGYEVTTLKMTDTESGWQRVACAYWLDGAEVTEATYQDGMRQVLGLKS